MFAPTLQAYLAYGIPRSDIKFFAMLQKVISTPTRACFLMLICLHCICSIMRLGFFFVLDAVVKTGEYNNVKYLLPQAAYTVGGHSFNAATMEFSLLKSKSTSHRSQLVRTHWPSVSNFPSY